MSEQLTPTPMFDENEIDLLLDGLDMLEERPAGTPANVEANFSGYFVGSQEEIRKQVEERVKDARIELRNRKFRIILLKAKLVQASMNQMAGGLFSVRPEGPLRL